MRESTLFKVFSCLFIGALSSYTYASEENMSKFKKNGVSVEWYQHELDLKITDIDFPGMTQEQMNTLKGQLESSNEVEAINLRMDHQVNTHLNLYGSIGKITEKTKVNFSGLGMGMSDLVVDNKGTTYTIGANLTGKYHRFIPSLHYMHSRIDLNNSANIIKVHSVVPSLGMKTKYGLIKAGLIYQDIDAEYSGTISTPLVNDVPVYVSTENKDRINIMGGLNTRLSRDFYLDTQLALDGRKKIQIQINKRF